MHDPQDGRLRWIGIVSFYVGAAFSNAELPADMVPINRILFAVNCALVLTRLLTIAVGGGLRLGR